MDEAGNSERNERKRAKKEVIPNCTVSSPVTRKIPLFDKRKMGINGCETQPKVLYTPISLKAIAVQGKERMKE